MKRRYKVLGGLGAVVVVGGVAAFVFRSAIFIFVLGMMLRPPLAFNVADTPAPPDYSSMDTWVAHPEKDDPSDVLPSNFGGEDAAFKDEVDVFYIHPTGFFGKHNWNAAIGELSDPGIPVEVMLTSQATPFNGCGKVYAPHYRQATLYSFFEPSQEPEKDNGFQALDLAYEDVAMAFDYFMEHYNKDRPFILAGHSQGSHHALRLLAEKIDGTEHFDRLIAAYAIGCGMPMDYFDRVLTDAKPCTSPDQLGAVIHWDTFKEGTTPDRLGFHHYPTGWEMDGDKAHYVVNPLTWTSSEERAPASANLGSLVPAGEMEDISAGPGALAPEYTWAECHGDALWVADQDGTAFGGAMALGGAYHIYDYHFFWQNIRENAELRAKTWLDANKK